MERSHNIDIPQQKQNKFQSSMAYSAPLIINNHQIPQIQQDVIDDKIIIKELVEFSTKDLNENKLALKVGVLGKMGAGKSSLLTSLTNRTFISGLKSNGVTKRTEYVAFEYSYKNILKQILFVDTIGFDDDGKNIVDLLSSIALDLSASVIDIFVYVIKIGRLTSYDRIVLDYIKNKFGNEFAKRCVVVFTNIDTYFYQFISDKSIKTKRHVTELMKDPNTINDFSPSSWFEENEPDIGKLIRRNSCGIFFVCSEKVLIEQYNMNKFINAINHYLISYKYEPIDRALWRYIIETVHSDYSTVKKKLEKFSENPYSGIPILGYIYDRYLKKDKDVIDAKIKTEFENMYTRKYTRPYLVKQEKQEKQENAVLDNINLDDEYFPDISDEYNKLFEQF
jgi:small GTP-binding protein